MKKIMNKILCCWLVVFLLVACNSFLDVETPDNLVQKEFWQNRDQVFSSLMGVYTSLHNSLNSLHVWGDIRSSLYAPGDGDEFSSSYAQFLRHDIYPDNSLTSWADIYKAISWSNSFLKNAPGTLLIDPTFSETELNNMLGEVHAIRALYYFYLVRAFKEVPIIKDPYESDRQNIDIAVSSEADVLSFIEEDLNFALKNAPETFSDAREKFGRITKNAVRALWADVKLWKNEYQECIDLCKELDQVYANSLVNPLDWYTIFYPGNSSESIFELQYTQEGPVSPLFNWFSFVTQKTEKYLANMRNVQLNASTLYPIDQPEYWCADTIRLKTYAAFSNSGSSAGNMEVYKYLGQASYQRAYRSETDRTANYIFYRYREILLMKAEAYGMLGKYDEAEAAINIIRKYCNIPELTLGEAGDGTDFFTNLLMEREFELGFEGKEWFAAVRIARRAGYQNVLLEKSANENAMGLAYQMVKARLLNSESWFLPYNKTEVDNNQQLEQKDFYKNK